MTSRPAAPPRNRAVLVLDVVASIVIIAFGIVLALVVIATAAAYGNTPAGNPTLMTVAVLGIIAVAVIATALGIGFFIVALLRRRVAFVWPLIALVVTVAAFYGGTALASSALA
jgi:ABC-type multidrug transport system permease subunit